MAPAVRNLTFHGYRYSCLVHEQPDPRLSPVVLLPGADQQADAFGGPCRLMTRWATCVGIDLPGGPGADPLPPRYGPGFLADCVAHTIGELGLGRVNLCGASAATPVAYQAAVSHPEHVARVALIGFMTTAPEETDAFEREAHELLTSGRTREWAGLMVRHLFCHDARRVVRGRSMLVKLFLRTYANSNRNDLARYRQMAERFRLHRDWFPGVGLPQPALFFTGEHDRITPPEEARAAARLCADARTTTVKEADHMLFAERMPETVDLLTRFFSGESLEGLPYCGDVEYFGTGARPAAAMPGA
ncbi:alpha/beta fold hydrolase [Streptomyces gamaensis]|uniref:Alpha/beta fold hydrolase n=1 Tax=Streptomyces gamaensis TaxID=1763542 RepID=A0ABW0Z0J9_9ACTN